MKRLSWLILCCACAGETSATRDSDRELTADTAPALDADGDDALAADTDPPDAPDTIDAPDAIDAPDVPDAPLAVDYFDPERVLEVVIRMAPEDWDALRRQTRTLYDILGPGCLDQPVDDVFTYFPGDVTVDGVTVTRAGVRKKGFLGSLDAERPSLRIELDELVAGQRLGDLERLTLNNGRQDPSRLKTCLAYETFAAAGIAAPRCTFAHVTVNDRDLGLYAHVEAVKKPFLRAHFGEPLGELWEGQLSDFRAGWLATFEAEIDADADPAPLAAVATALAAPDDTLLGELDRVIDLDQFITFWATEGLIGHWDGYSGDTNNFFVYLDGRDGRLRFVPWGTDAAFTDPGIVRPGMPQSVFAVAALAHRLYAHPEGRSRYRAELGRLLAEVWDEQALMQRIADWDALTWDAREAGSGEAASYDLFAVRTFVQGRRAVLEAELAAPPPWPAPLREAVCAAPRGTVSGTFATTWGTLAIENLFTTGTGTFDVVSDALPPAVFAEVGAKAGEAPDELPGRAQIAVAARVVGGGFVVVVFYADMPLAPGALVLDHVACEAYVYYVEPPDGLQLLGLLGDGALDLTSAGVSPGAPIAGSFSGTLLGFF